MIVRPPRSSVLTGRSSARKAQLLLHHALTALAPACILSVTLLAPSGIHAERAFGGTAERPFEIADVPPPKVAVDPSALAAAHALAAAQQQLSQGDVSAAGRSLARARNAALLADYVALFEARLLLAEGRPADAAAAARRGVELHQGKPVATAFSELLGDALVLAGNETGARGAWQVAFEATRSADRRAELERRIITSHERTGTLQAAISDRSGQTTVADGTALPPSIVRELATRLSAQEHLQRADDLKGRGHSEDAVTAYDAALAAGLDDADATHARLSRGRSLFRVRRYSEAAAALGALLPEPEARFWHARSLARSGSTQKAIRAFEAIGAANDPRYGSWALYLAGTLLEDRDETARAMALYEQVAKHDQTERGTDALWRVGWSAYGSGDYQRSRDVFAEMAGRSETLGALRPRYWAARSAEQHGERDVALAEFWRLATAHPLSYYGWRAGQRLGADLAAQTAIPSRRLPPGSPRIQQREVDRIELLLEADLADFAQEELGSLVGRVRSLEDRKAVGRLYVRTGDFHRAQRLVVDAYQESLSRGIQPGNETLWWLSWPPAFREIVADVFPQDAVIEPALVWAIMREESGYRPWITSSAGARGLLQIMPATGAQLAKKNGYADFDPDDLYTPRVNIQLGAAYLDELRRRFPGRLSAAIGSYNAGARAVNGWLRGDQKNQDDDAWVEDIPYRQTRFYVKRVLRSLHVYQTVYADTALYAPANQKDES